MTCLSFVQGIVYEFPIPVIYQGMIGCVLGVLVILLRMDTTDAIDDKQ
jgi:NhaP-type Na+/H+ or K+/H+ antiporter